MSAQNLRRSWSAGRNVNPSQTQASSRSAPPEPASIGSGPGVMRFFGENSQFKVASDNYDFGSFQTTDFSAINEARHNWTREDTFQTAVGHLGPPVVATSASRQLNKIAKRAAPPVADLEDSHIMGTCSFHKEWLIAMKNKIIEGVVDGMQDKITLLRQDISKVQEEVQSEVRLLREDLAKDAKVHYESLRDELVQTLRSKKDEGNVQPAIDGNSKIFITEGSDVDAEVNSSRESHGRFRGDIDSNKVDVDLLIMNEMRAGHTKILEQMENDLQHILQQISTNKLEVDLTPVVQEMHSVQGTILEQISTSKTEVDFTPLIKEMHSVQATTLDTFLCPVLTQLQTIQKMQGSHKEITERLQESLLGGAAEDSIEAREETSTNLSTGVTTGLQNSTEATDETCEIKALDTCQVNLDPILEAIAGIDFTPILEEIREMNSVNTSLHVDFTPVLEEIRKVNNVNASLNVDLRPVLEDIMKINSVNASEILL